MNKSTYRKNIRKIKIRIGIIITISVYIFGVLIFSNKFLPFTKINGISYSFKTPYFVANNITNHTSNYTLKIKGKNTYDEVYSKDFDYTERYIEGSISKLKNEKQNKYLWFINIFKNKDYKLNTKVIYDKYKFSKIYDGLELSDEDKIEDSKSALIKFKDNGDLKIIKEKRGNRVNKDKLEAGILKSFHNNISEINLENGYYIEPKLKVGSKKFEEMKKKINSLKNDSIKFKIGNKEEVIPTKTMQRWIITDEEGNITGSYKDIKEYVTSLSKMFDTYYKTRDFKTTNGNIVKVKAGNYGRRTDINKTVKEIQDAIKDNKKNVEAIYSNKTLNGAEDIGNTYIEVSKKDQMMWCYKDGKLILTSPIVTGNPNTGGDTPTGVYKIWSKERNRKLVGEDYSSPVSYWMPVTYTGVGIHDASWQPSFGGNAYLYRGSHGCINTPYDNVSFVFENYSNNTPVIIY